MAVDESTLEHAIISELQTKGYEYLYGPDVDRKNNAGIDDYHEVILKECFYSSMLNINPGITHELITEAYRTIKNLGFLSLVELNAAFHRYLIEGVPVPYQKDGENRTFTVKLVDFSHPEANDFKVVNQFTVIEHENRRPDVLIFINGIPMVLFELKNMANADTSILNAYNQVRNYQHAIPSLFWYNAFNVISDGISTRVGTITADFTRYMAWKSEDGERPQENATDFFTIALNGMFPKERLLDIIRHYIVFQDIDGKTVKILAAYHQYFCVKKAVESTRNALAHGSKRAGVVWHTQGSGKSLSMAFYSGIVVTDPDFNNPTIVVLTDRNDLDDQLFGTFSACSKLLLRQTPIQAESRKHLRELLQVKAGGIYFTTIQKFDEYDGPLNERSNIIFLADEAHRSQYGLDDTFDKFSGVWKPG
ncbi:MAG: HsdR family type I site-specific deoxyribonuclease, partial [Bacillota bacterium]|nr:HsdR family type I site-specific deoxyribonuclease [Bacillota bacterium]